MRSDYSEIMINMKEQDYFIILFKEKRKGSLYNNPQNIKHPSLARNDLFMHRMVSVSSLKDTPHSL